MSYGLGPNSEVSGSDESSADPPPSLWAYTAVLLELGMLGTFAVNHSVCGALLWAVYLPFSATWSLFRWIVS